MQREFCNCINVAGEEMSVPHPNGLDGLVAQLLKHPAMIPRDSQKPLNRSGDMRDR